MPFIGFGCDLQLNGSSIGSVVDINGPGIKAKDVDISYIQMPDVWRRFQAGLADGGEITFTLIYDKVKYNAILNNFRVTNTYTIVFSDIVSTASTEAMSGYINDISKKFPLDDLIVVDVKIKVSGKATFTQGT